MTFLLETETISALLNNTEKPRNLSTVKQITENFKIKGAEKIGDFSDTNAFDDGLASINHGVVEVQSAQVFMPNGFVILEENYLIEESLWQSAIHKRDDVVVNKDTGWKYNIEKPSKNDVFKVKNDGMLFAYHRFHYHYFHWFIDCLPRLWLASEQKIEFSEFYCGEFSDNSFQQKSIDLLEIKGKRLRLKSKKKVFEFNSFLYPCSTLTENLKVRPSFRDGKHHKGGWDPVYLKNINDRITSRILPARTTAHKRLYIKRPQIAHRRLLSADLFEAFLDDNGFLFVDPGSYSFEEQVQLFHEAEFIVAAHGAGLTNILWANAKKLRGVFEITIEGLYDPGYTFIASGLDIPIHVFPAAPIEHRHGPAFADLSLDSAEAVKALASIL